jgi:hypothetical protein
MREVGYLFVTQHLTPRSESCGVFVVSTRGEVNMTEEPPTTIPIINKQQVAAVIDVLGSALDIVSMHKSNFFPQEYLYLETWTGDKAVSTEVQLAALVKILADMIQIYADDDPPTVDGVIALVNQQLQKECHYTLTLWPKDTPRPTADIIALITKPKTDQEEK